MRIFYVDMDGVLARWNESASEEDTHEPGYFLDRERDEMAIRLVKRLVNDGEMVVIRSAVYADDHSAGDKAKWLFDAGLGSVSRKFVPYGTDKTAGIEQDPKVVKVLIDDFGKNLCSWQQAGEGFVAVKYYNGVNDRPKLVSEAGGIIRIQPDSWTGYSIDTRMSVDLAYNILMGIVRQEEMLREVSA